MRMEMNADFNWESALARLQSVGLSRSLDGICPTLKAGWEWILPGVDHDQTDPVPGVFEKLWNEPTNCMATKCVRPGASGICPARTPRPAYPASGSQREQRGARSDMRVIIRYRETIGDSR